MQQRLPISFIAGWNKNTKTRRRLKNPWSKLGLHHPYNKTKGNLIPTADYIMETVEQYFSTMQAGEGIYEMMKKTKPHDMIYVRDSTLARIGGYHISMDVTSDVLSVGSGDRVYTGPEPRSYNNTVVIMNKTKLIYDRAPTYKGADGIELLRNLAGD